MSQIDISSGDEIVVEPSTSQSVAVEGGAVYISYGSNPQQEAQIADHEERLDTLQQTISDLQNLEPGKSAYELAVDNGFIGSMDEWIQSLKGTPGLVAGHGEPPTPLPAGYSPGMVYLDLDTYQLYQLG